MSKILTFSRGISKAPELPELLEAELCHISFLKNKSVSGFSNCAVVGWGKKENTLRAINFACKKGIPYWSLEDGFISYLGHPALGDRRFSLIVDKSGIYYDATQPSDIETLLNSSNWLTPRLEARSAHLLETIRKYQISKYNHEPISSSKFKAGGNKRVLVVDQTYGDCSVRCGMANESSFQTMLEAALSENPNSEIWVKVHPDVILGKKKGYFELEACGKKIKGFDNDRIKVIITPGSVLALCITRIGNGQAYNSGVSSQLRGQFLHRNFGDSSCIVYKTNYF